MSGRVNVRTPGWIEQYLDIRSRRAEDWSNSSEVARDMIEKGIILSELAKMGDGVVDSPVLSWSRIRGIFPGDDMLVCPGCPHSDRFLFRLRNHYGTDAIQCLVCGRLGTEDEFKADMPEGHHWATSNPEVGFHIVDTETGDALCGEYKDEKGRDICGELESGMELSISTPAPEERPDRICGVCWDMNRRRMI